MGMVMAESGERGFQQRKWGVKAPWGKRKMTFDWKKRTPSAGDCPEDTNFTSVKNLALSPPLSRSQSTKN